MQFVLFKSSNLIMNCFWIFVFIFGCLVNYKWLFIIISLYEVLKVHSCKCCSHNNTSFPREYHLHSYTSGAEGIRTPDPLLARQVLSQLSYNPRLVLYSVCLSLWLAVGLNGLEPSTSRLSGVRSNQLSYKPFLNSAATYFPTQLPMQYHRPGKA